MKRKVIQIAESTQLISIPRQWAKDHNLKKGQEIEVTIKGDLLEISTEPGTKPSQELEVDISRLTPFLANRFLARAYQKGYDKITIHFTSDTPMQGIREKIPELLGFEILIIGRNSCVIQSISSHMEVNFATLLRRAFLILVEMSEICQTGYAKGDAESLRNLFYRDLEVNKFCYFCLRCINKGYHNEGPNTTILYYQIESLEDLGDEFKALAKVLAELPPKNVLLQQILDLSANLTKQAYEFFYNPSGDLAVRCIEIYKEILALIEKNLVQKDANFVKCLYLLMNVARILYHIPTMRLDTLTDIRKNGN